MIETAILTPIIMIFAAVIIGMIGGILSGIFDIIASIRNKFKSDPEPIIYHIHGSETIYTTSIKPEQSIIDELLNLEYSADVTRHEISYYTQLAELTFDEVEKIKLKKKIAAAGKRLAADNKKINKIKDKYFID